MSHARTLCSEVIVVLATKMLCVGRACSALLALALLDLVSNVPAQTAPSNDEPRQDSKESRASREQEAVKAATQAHDEALKNAEQKMADVTDFLDKFTRDAELQSDLSALNKDA